MSNLYKHNKIHESISFDDNDDDSNIVSGELEHEINIEHLKNALLNMKVWTSEQFSNNYACLWFNKSYNHWEVTDLSIVPTDVNPVHTDYDMCKKAMESLSNDGYMIGKSLYTASSNYLRMYCKYVLMPFYIETYKDGIHEIKNACYTWDEVISCMDRNHIYKMYTHLDNITKVGGYIRIDLLPSEMADKCILDGMLSTIPMADDIAKKPTDYYPSLTLDTKKIIYVYIDYPRPTQISKEMRFTPAEILSYLYTDIRKNDHGKLLIDVNDIINYNNGKLNESLSVMNESISIGNNTPIHINIDDVDIISYGKYYEGNNRAISHAIKNNEPAAIEYAAAKMAELLPHNSVLVPVPNHGGKALETLTLAKALSEKTGAQIANVLIGKSRQSNYQMKKSGTPLSEKEMAIRQVAPLPNGYNIVIIDGVIDTGTTAFAAVHALHADRHCTILTYAISDTLLQNRINESISFDDDIDDDIDVAGKTISHIKIIEDIKRALLNCGVWYDYLENKQYAAFLFNDTKDDKLKIKCLQKKDAKDNYILLNHEDILIAKEELEKEGYLIDIIKRKYTDYTMYINEIVPAGILKYFNKHEETIYTKQEVIDRLCNGKIYEISQNIRDRQHFTVYIRQDLIPSNILYKCKDSGVLIGSDNYMYIPMKIYWPLTEQKPHYMLFTSWERNENNSFLFDEEHLKNN